VVTGPQHGSLSVSGATATYTPAANYHGPDSFTFRANDGAADSNVATVSIAVQPVNDAPVAADQAVATDEDTAVGIVLGVTDADGDALTYTVVTGPQHGTLSGSGATRTYTPAPNYFGPDTFTFRVNDGAADSNVATVSITVRPINDPPSCVAAVPRPLHELWPPNHRLEGVGILGLSDVEGEAITVTATAVRQDEPVLGNGSGNKAPDAVLSPLQVRVERQGGRDGRVYHITFRATDASGGSCTRTVTLCVPHDQGDGQAEVHDENDDHVHEGDGGGAGSGGSGGHCVDQGPLYDSLENP
jgi:hypothetical protein